MSSSSHEIVLTSSPDGPIIAYDASSGALLARFTGTQSPRQGLTLVGNTSLLARFTGTQSPRQGLTLVGNTLIAASHISSTTASSSIHLYNWWSSTVFHHIPLLEPAAPLIATPDGLYLFAGGISGNIHALSLPSRNVLKEFHAHDSPVSCLKISDDGSLLISGGDDGLLQADSVTDITSGNIGLCNSTNFLLTGLYIPNKSEFYAAGLEKMEVFGFGKSQQDKSLSLGSKMGRSISDMVVATGTGISYGKGHGKANTRNGRYIECGCKDRRRAIDMLESAIEMYERLLELILKEAKKGSSNGGE
uniref:Uncharacterized protein n=1 Tax=Fagus sylvatica TaxID=28930 RepID=A0A2N9I1J7_FAGSY